MKQKIKEQSELIKKVKKLKRDGKKIVVCNGSYDLLHAGHVDFLKQAKEEGDFLIVLLNSDESVRAYKGSKRPINKEENRVEVLSVLEMVDFVSVFDEVIPLTFLKKIEPDVYCQGGDWGEESLEAELVEKQGGKVKMIDLEKEISTTGLIEKIKRKPEPSKAVFLDRDGTINFNEPEYVHKIENFKFKPDAIKALKKLTDSDYRIVIVTNQSGVGRDYYSEAQLKKLHQWMLHKLKEEGVTIDKIYYCPHHPKDNCNCRKPETGLFEQAQKELNINLSRSYMIGDSKEDIEAGAKAGCETILVGSEQEKADYQSKNLMEAAEIILA